MTIYIAGKMTGEKCYNFPKFYEVEEMLLSNGHKVLNPAKIPNLCPKCKVVLHQWFKKSREPMRYKRNYCCDCGQKIDWIKAHEASIKLLKGAEV